MLKVVQAAAGAVVPDAPEGSLLDEIAREGARNMFAAALRAEADAYLDALTEVVDANGHRMVVGNGHAQARTVMCAAGAIEVRAPRVNDKRIDEETGERKRFASAILPAWCRCSPKITEVLPLLYLHGLSTSDFGPALGQFLGSSTGLSASVITKLTETRKAEQRAFAARDLAEVDYVYLWAEGVHVTIGLEEHKLCLLVLIGVRADGRKELVALADGYRESSESWAELLRDCTRRGMRAPMLAVGDGALRFWGALREVFPETREQRCWFHKIANCLGALPKSAHLGAKKALAEIWNAEDRRHALDAVASFIAAYGAKFPKASRRSPMISTNCWRSTTTRPSTGFTCARQIPSSPPSPRSDTGPRSPEDQGRAPRGWPWPSSSSRPPRTAGARSTHPRSSLSSARARPSRPAS
jgi:transposase-like protein